MEKLGVGVIVDSIESITLSDGESAFVFYLSVKNNLPNEICVKLPLATYLTAKGEQIEQDGWLSGLINGNVGATIRSKAFKKMGLIIRLNKLKEISSGDRLYITLNLDSPSKRFNFGFVCEDQTKTTFSLCESDQTVVKQANGGAASGKRDITNCVERLELLEDQFGIAISGLYASCKFEEYGPYHALKINFDVTSLSGSTLKSSLKLNASAYNEAGQLLDTTSSYIHMRDFLGFGSISIEVHLDQEPAKIRLSPAKI